MPAGNQEPPEPIPPPSPDVLPAPVEPAGPVEAIARAFDPCAPAPAQPTLSGGPRLRIWFLALLTAGGGSVLLGFGEAAILTALAGLFVAAQVADLDPRRRDLYRVLSWVVPVGGAATFAALMWLLARSDLPGALGPVMVGFAGLGAAVSLLSLSRPFADALCILMFRAEPPSHTLRLAARLVMMGLLLAIPGWYGLKGPTLQLLEGPDSPLDRGMLGTGLVGYVLLSLGAVGFLVRRDLRSALDRLGVRPLTGRQLAITAAGVVILLGLNAGLDLLQKSFFPELWESDQRMTEAIALRLGVAQVLMLGLSAGIGEELTLRGALQPRLGIVLTALLFASLHVQYSWFGMMVIFLFGLLLGIIRDRTSTSVAILVHTLYDIVALATL